MATVVAARRAVFRRARRHRWLLLAMTLLPPLAWFGLLYLLPLAYLLITSLWTVNAGITEQIWTLDQYRELTSDPLWLHVLWRTVAIASLVTLTTFALGFPLAYFLVRYTTRWRQLLYLGVLVPLWSSYLVRVFAWKTILGHDGLLNSFLLATHIVRHPVEAFLYSNTSVYITLVHVWLPYMVLPIYAALERIQPSLLEASADLGARGYQTVARVVWPLAFPGVLAGAIFVFSLSMGDFITPQLMGNGTQFIGNVIADQFGIASNQPLGAALSMLPLSVLTVFLWLTRRFGVLEAL
jgi:ABC-type spermidine/putrescine transport system permease subunit I